MEARSEAPPPIIEIRPAHQAVPSRRTPIVDAKLRVPSVDSEFLIERPRLTRQIGAQRGSTFSLVTAPAGYGKTTALALSALQADRPTAWVSAEARDNDPARFLEYVAAALRTLVPEQASGTADPHIAPDADTTAEAIVQHVSAIARLIGRPFALVVDDFHHLDHAVILDAVRMLVDFPPPRFTLLIASRTEPALPLARWRVQGKLTEIRAGDLRFTVEEAARLCARALAVPLSASDTARLVERTEGWVAALRLLLLRLRRESGVTIHDALERVTASNRQVFDFFEDEVLSALPIAQRTFLERTAILERLSDDLCAAVIVSDVAPGTLRALARSGVLLSALDDEEQWFRYHPLFAALLHRRLAAATPGEEIRALHRRASAWWEAFGDREAAIDHAIQAADWARATDLIGPLIAELAAQNQIARLRTWFDSLPTEIVDESPEFSYWYAWTLVRIGLLDTYDRYLASAERLWAERGNTPMLAAAKNVRATAAYLRADEETCCRLAAEALADLPEDYELEPQTARLCLGLGYSLARANDARLILEDLANQAPIAPSIDLVVQVTLGWVDIVQGRLNTAKHRFERALDAHQHVFVDAVRRARVWLAAIYLEQGDDVAAEQLLRQADDHARRVGFSPLFANSSRWWLELYLRRGRDADALALLDEGLANITSSAVATIRIRLDALRVGIWARLGRMDLVEPWVCDRGLSPTDTITYANQEAYAAYATWLLHDGQADTALRVAHSLCETAEREGRIGNLVPFLIIQALAEDARGDRRAALATTTRLLELAEAGGYVMTLVESADRLRPLLRECAARGICVDYVAHIDAAAKGERVDQSPEHAAGDLPMREPLSERELEVLRLIAVGLSNREIADQLYVTVPTVKRHLTNVFGKLAAANRTEAVFKARSQHII